jgi:F420-dependent methylenetetrahydromethanopterin dehydrogenase
MSSGNESGAVDEAKFAQSMAIIRARFPSKLAEKFKQIDHALPLMRGENTDAVEAVAAAYRRIHEICGVASTIGFDEIDRTARVCDAVLIEPFRARRGLSEEEFGLLTLGLDSLRNSARTQTQFEASNRS